MAFLTAKCAVRHCILDARDREELLNRLKNDAIKVFPKEKVTLCRDEKDNMVLECALAGKADFIVTGDKDLLS